MVRPRRMTRPAAVLEPEQDPKLVKALLKKEAYQRYRDKLKSDSAQYEEFKLQDASKKRLQRKTMSDEQRIAYNEKAKLRNRACRARKKEKAKSLASTQAAPAGPPAKRQMTRSDAKKLEEKRERNRLSQQKRRANMHPQKKRREREKNLAYYYASKSTSTQNTTKPKQPSHTGTPTRTNTSTPCTTGQISPTTTRPCRGPRLRSAISRLKKKLTGNGNLLVSIKGLVKSLSKKEPEKLKSTGINYCSPTKPQPTPDWLHNRRDKKAVSARRLFQGRADLSPYKKGKRHENVVRHFYEERSTFIPGKMGVNKRYKPQKILSKSIVNLHKDFISEYGNMVSKATFFRHRPNNVKSFTKTPFRQCLCELCLNPMLKAKVLNKEVCEEERVCGLKELIGTTLCESDRIECLERKCGDCGVNGLDQVWVGVPSNKQFRWHRWEKVEKKDGSSRLDLVLKDGTFHDVIKEMKCELLNLPMHDFIHRWQTKQFSMLINDIPEAWSVVVLDFAENYLCQQQDQPQSAYFGYSQVTVHPCVIYYGCACGLRKTLNWTFVSDVLKHGADMVHVITKKILSHLASLNIKKVVIFSDGCAAQYKSKLPFFHLQSYGHLSLDVERCFFGARHGKNPCDALGGILKQAASRAVKARQCVIQSAQDLYQFANRELVLADKSCSESSSHTSRQFFLLNAEDIPETVVSLKTLPGTRRLHSMRPSADGLLSRNLSCFCEACISQSAPGPQCCNSYYVQPWRLAMKVSDFPIFQDNDCERGLSGDTVSEDLGSPFDLKISGKDKVIPLDLGNSCDSIMSVVPSEDDLEMSRTNFFCHLQAQIVRCDSYLSLQKLVKNMSSIVDRFQLPDIGPKSVLGVRGSVDTVAKNLKPDGLDALFPVLTVADGNCVSRSLSLHCFGDQAHHVEIRCRIVFELVANCFDYLSLNPDDLMFLVQLADTQCETTELTFQEEVMSIRKCGTYMGMWQFMAAANVFHCDIISIYPSLGPQTYRSFFNRTVNARRKLFSHALTLMWSATEQHTEDMPAQYWTANHVVPLMGLSCSIEVEEDSA